MAEHIGLSLPSMSKMVDGLVSRGLVAREPSASDRRRLSLGLTPQGQRMLERARQGTQDALALRLDQLTPQQRQALLRDLGRLGQAFAAPAAPGRDKTKGSGKGLGRRPAPA
jgi:DNA-binding MarR family transcriptional regulator